MIALAPARHPGQGRIVEARLCCRTCGKAGQLVELRQGPTLDLVLVCPERHQETVR